MIIFFLVFQVTMYVFNDVNYTDTVYVNLYIDFTPSLVHTLADSMNITVWNYASQNDYFQSIKCCSWYITFDWLIFFFSDYRRRFTNFMDPSREFMINRQMNIKQKHF